MAVQSSFYVGTALETRTFPSTKHIATKQHMAVWRQQSADDVWVQMSVNEYQLISNACVLNQLLSTSLYKSLEVRVADEPDELTTSPSDISVVAGIADDISTCAGISDDITTVATNPDLLYKVTKTSDTGSMVTPSGTTAERDASPVVGYFRYNSEEDSFEGYTLGDGWGAIAGSGGDVAVTTYTFTSTQDQDTYVCDYTVGLLDVYFNGIKIPYTDYVATNGTSVTLNFTADLNDVVEVMAYVSFAVAGAYTKAEADAKFVVPTDLGATGGGTDKVFYENDQVITTDYTLTTGQNAMTAGTVTINDGVTVTIPDGASWSIV